MKDWSEWQRVSEMRSLTKKKTKKKAPSEAEIQRRIRDWKLSSHGARDLRGRGSEGFARALVGDGRAETLLQGMHVLLGRLVSGNLRDLGPKEKEEFRHMLGPCVGNLDFEGCSWKQERMLWRADEHGVLRFGRGMDHEAATVCTALFAELGESKQVLRKMSQHRLFDDTLLFRGVIRSDAAERLALEDIYEYGTPRYYAEFVSNTLRRRGGKSKEDADLVLAAAIK